MQGPSASAYVTYLRSEDALRAIQAVNNIYIDGRTLKASLGTTKYCSHFMKNQSCPKNDCMYLHELGRDFIETSYNFTLMSSLFNVISIPTNLSCKRSLCTYAPHPHIKIRCNSSDIKREGRNIRNPNAEQ